MFYLIFGNSCREFKSLTEARLKQVGLTQIGIHSKICNKRGEEIITCQLNVINFMEAK